LIFCRSANVASILLLQIHRPPGLA
jgi:hypothetical protein